MALTARPGFERRPKGAAVALALLLGCGALAMVVAVPSMVRACTLDGKPTAFADGRRAVLTVERDAGAAVGTWAPFSFAGRYRAGTPVRLTEDGGALKAVLPPQSSRRPWAWTFGDGTGGRGWTMDHRYARPGVYRITVKAYYPTWQEYIPFDTVRLTVAR